MNQSDGQSESSIAFSTVPFAALGASTSASRSFTGAVGDAREHVERLEAVEVGTARGGRHTSWTGLIQPAP